MNQGENEMMDGILYGLGVGPGDPELITVKALRIMEKADVIACPARGASPGIAYQITESGKKAYLVENCGMPEERVYSGIESIPDQAGYFSILIVKKGDFLWLL